jgi:hypothetical protein
MDAVNSKVMEEGESRMDKNRHSFDTEVIPMRLVTPAPIKL